MTGDVRSDENSGANADKTALFISRAGVDADVAERIARIYNAAGYPVTLQQWTFANKSFISEMQTALADGTRVIALLSPAYLTSDYCAAEWQSVLADDPLNRNSRLIVLRIADCVPTGLLKALMYWDVVGITDSAEFERIVLAALGANKTVADRVLATGPAGVPATETNLPPQLTRFIERAAFTDDVARQIAATRIVSLIGAGGVGKTRMAIYVAAQIAGDYADGVWFADFAQLTEGSYVVSEIAAMLGIIETSGRPLIETLCAVMRTKRMLLVFDNCEHVIAHARTVADAVVRHCASVRILVTSREPLGYAGEAVIRVPSLGLPAEGTATTAQAALGYEAVALFVDRALSVNPQFVLTNDNAALVARICRRLDGIALAIELAAARLRLLSLADLAVKLDERFRLLTGGSKARLPRQQTMRALIDWSYNLLNSDEQRIFRRLAIFSDGWTLESATAICGDADVDEYAMLDILTSLADKSLVVVDATAEQRMRLLESMREYARELARKHDEYESLAAARANYFAAFAGVALTTVASDTARGQERTFTSARIREIEAELENIREVLAWSLQDKHEVKLGSQLAFVLGRFWAMRYPREGLRWYELAQNALRETNDSLLSAKLASAIAAMLPHGSFERLEATRYALGQAQLTGDELILARAYCAIGEQVGPLRQTDEAAAAFSEALRLARALGEDWTAARALAGLGMLALGSKDIPAARVHFDAAIRQFERLGAIDGIAYVCIALGEADFTEGKIDAAIAITLRALHAYEELKNDRSRACAANYLASFSLVAGKHDEARAYAREALRLLENDRHPAFIAQAIHSLALVATLNGHPERGALLLGYAQAESRKLAHALEVAAASCDTLHVDLLMQHFGAGAELRRRLDAGAVIGEDRAMNEALAV